MARRTAPPPVEPGTILLIGGTGDVGRRLVSLLLDQTRHRVQVISRSGRTPDARVEALKLDIGASDDAAGLALDATVVNLTEATPPSVAARVVQAGGRFLETSASPDYVQAINDAAAAAGGPGTGVICVGTAPGLSTLIAADVARTQGCATIDIGLELGMGRHYGAAATEWSIGALGAPYRTGGTGSALRPGDQRRSFAFGQTSRERPAIGTGFPHQGIAGHSGAGSQVQTRTFLAFDPSYVTRLVLLLLRLGLGPVLARHKRGLTRVLMRLPSLGRTSTRIAVEARAADGRVLAARHVTVGDQAEVTAAMIVATIRAFEDNPAPPSGATTIVDHLTPDAALDALRGLLPEMAIETWSGGPEANRS